MSPFDRILSDRAAQTLEIEALSILDGAELIAGPAYSLAIAVVALARDRQARLELAAGAALRLTGEGVQR